VNRLIVGIATAVLALAAAAPPAAAAPLYDIKATWGDTNLPPGNEGQFSIEVRNIGTQDGDGALVIEDQLPVGVTATHIEGPFANYGGGYECSGLTTEKVKCTMSDFWVSEFEPPSGGHGLAQAPGTQTASLRGLSPTGYLPLLIIDVAVDTEVSGVGVNTATASGGGAVAPTSDVDEVLFNATPSAFGLLQSGFESDVFDAAYPVGGAVRQAGDHPFEQRTNFDLNESSRIGTDGTRYITPSGQIKTAEVTLPRGTIGNPEALPKCDPVDFSQEGSTFDSTACPANTQVGYLNGLITGGPNEFGQGGFFGPDGTAAHVPLYNLVPPKGTPVDLGFSAGIAQAHVFAQLDPAQNYAIKTVTPNIQSLVAVRGVEVTIWGVPGDPAHDRFRYYPEKQQNGDVVGAPFGGAAIRPFLTNPMDCGFENGGTRIRLDSYQHPDLFTPEPALEYPSPLNVTGCGDLRFRFEPDIALQPTDRHAGAPTGLDVHLKVPQRNDEVKDAAESYAKNGFVNGISTPPIKKAVVTFPEGMTISPSAAQGLGSCTSEEISLGTDKPVRCPDNSQYGTLTLHTPLFPVNAQPEGWIYIAKQNDNPFHNFLSLYLVIQEPDRGVLVKIPAKLELDPQTGRIVSTFDDLPQFPVSDMQMNFKGGVRAGLVEPSTCGRKTITAEFFSWQDPAVPQVVKNSYDITQKPDGSPCVGNLGERPFKPSLDAGTTDNTAGGYAPFVFRLTRTDDDQEFSQLGVTLPPGLVAKFAGVTMCADAGIAQAIARSGAGDGALEQANPSCPASSLIGSTEAGVGVGVPLTFVPGKVYLAGPYRGAPLSLVVITPTLVGPYDLGVIAVRTALNVNPETAQGSALTDPLPRIVQGIPVRIRDIRLKLDRKEFTLNPTSCAEKTITAHVTGTGGDVNTTADDTAVAIAERFQAAECASLRFKPKLSFHLFGGTHRGAHPKLKAVVKPRADDANFATASVALPGSEFLDQGHIRTVCTRVQFAANQCPTGSVYGHAVAKTPLFDQPLSGPVYLRSSSHSLPDLVATLKGPASQPVEVDLVGRIDSANGGIRTSFATIPDAPVSSFTLAMEGGKKGLLVNSTNLCAKTNRATAKFTSQNGKRLVLHPAMRASCPKKARQNGHAKR
jgi:hypothetical protein